MKHSHFYGCSSCYPTSTNKNPKPLPHDCRFPKTMFEHHAMYFYCECPHCSSTKTRCDICETSIYNCTCEERTESTVTTAAEEEESEFPACVSCDESDDWMTWCTVSSDAICRDCCGHSICYSCGECSSNVCDEEDYCDDCCECANCKRDGHVWDEDNYEIDTITFTYAEWTLSCENCSAHIHIESTGVQAGAICDE